MSDKGKAIAKKEEKVALKKHAKKAAKHVAKKHVAKKHAKKASEARWGKRGQVESDLRIRSWTDDSLSPYAAGFGSDLSDGKGHR